MKYFIDIIKIFLFILVFYLPIIFISIYKDLNQVEKNINSETIIKIDKLSKNINNYIKEGRVLEACQRLEAEILSENIFYYSLKSNSIECTKPINSVQMYQASQSDLIQETKFEDGRHYFIYSNKENSIEWSTAANFMHVGLFKSSIKNQTNIIVQSIIENLILVLYVFCIFIFLAFMIFAQLIQNQFRKKEDSTGFLYYFVKYFSWLQLQDLKTLQFVASASLKKSELMQKDQDLLETSLEHSILNEIKKNNHMIPYTFRGTVAKVDINGFSKVVSSGNNQISYDLTKILEDFGCELLFRYKGLFEKTVGDEIVVVFKTSDSALLATAFARDLMKEFSGLDFDFETDKRRFTLKSSISSSDLTFSKRAPGYGFLGVALTYTTRLLDVVSIKDRNILSCLKSQVFEVRSLVKIPHEVKAFEFKNMTASEGYLIDEFVKIEEIYENQTSLIKYFRSNEALIFLFNQIQVESDFEKLNHIFTLFCDITTQVVSEELILAWMDTLKVFEKRVMQDPALAFSFSRLIIEGSRLIPSKQWDAKCTQAIISISRFIEGRINASIVDVLIEKDLNNIALEQEKSFLLENDQSFRTRGNLLLNQAILKLTDSIFDKIIKMINSKNPLESSTGIYCACRVIIHYQKLNPAELETFMSYRKLSKILNHMYVSKNKDISERLLKLIDQVNSFNELTYKEPSL